MPRYRSRLMEFLPGVTPDNLTDDIASYLYNETSGVSEEMDAWQRRTWEHPGPYHPLPDHKEVIPEPWLPFIKDGETLEMIERKADASGFYSELEYLKWRQTNETDSQE